MAGAAIDAKLTGGTPLGSVMLRSVVELATPKLGEDVSYWFISDHANAELFVNNQPFRRFETGKGIAAYSKFDFLPNNLFYIGLSNDNSVQGINVNIKISLLWEEKKYEEVEYEEMVVKPIFEKQVVKEPFIIRDVQIPYIQK